MRSHVFPWRRLSTCRLDTRVESCARLGRKRRDEARRGSLRGCATGTRRPGYTVKPRFSRYCLAMALLSLAVVPVRSSSTVHHPFQLLSSRIFLIPGKSTPPLPSSKKMRLAAVVLYGPCNSPLNPPLFSAATSLLRYSIIL